MIDHINEKLNIRSIQERDADLLIPLMRQLVPDVNQSALKACISTYQHPPCLAFVGEIQNQIVGLVAAVISPYFHKQGYFLRITTLVVDQSFRKRKIGSSLLDEIEKIAKKQGCKSIEVTSGNHRKKDAHPFYQNSGFGIYDGIRLLKKIDYKPSQK